MATFDLHYYFDESVSTSSGQLFNDDGSTPNTIETGNYEVMHFTSSTKDKTTTIKLSSSIGKKYTATNKEVTLQLHNCNPKSVTINGKKVNFRADTSVVGIPIVWTKNTSTIITLEF